MQSKPHTQIEPLVVTIPEACRVAAVSRSELYRLMGSGRIRAVKHGVRTLIPMDSLRAHVAGLPAAEIKPEAKAA